MRIASLALAALLCTSGASVAADTARHEMPLDIASPSRIELVVRHTKARTAQSKTDTMWVETRSLMTIDADDATKGYKVMLKLVDRTASFPAVLPMLAATTPAELSYLTDENLRPNKLLDAEAVQARQVAAARRLAPEVGAMVEKMYAGVSAEAAAASMLKEQSYLSIGHNLGLTISVPVTYDAEQPSPFGGGALKSKGSITLDSYDDKTNLAVVTWKEVIDPASALALGARLAQQMTSKDVSAEMAEMQNQATKMEITKGCRYEIDTRNGFIGKADCYESVGRLGDNGSANEYWAITQTLKN